MYAFNTYIDYSEEEYEIEPPKEVCCVEYSKRIERRNAFIAGNMEIFEC